MFPDKKFFFFNDGWEDLGEENPKYQTVIVGKSQIGTVTTHDYCKTIIHIGRENNKLFKFCPRCKVKIENEKNNHILLGENPKILSIAEDGIQ